MGKKVGQVSLGIQVGIIRALLPMDYEPLQVYSTDYGLNMDVLYDDAMPRMEIAVFVFDTVCGAFEVPAFCGRHLGSAGYKHIFEVDPRSVEAQ